MRTSAPGNEDEDGVAGLTRHAVPRPARGFTLIELMVVIAIIAIAAGVASLALRDPAEIRLEREAARLSALLEAARTQSRALGVSVVWAPVDALTRARSGESETEPAQFRFHGLPDDQELPRRWLTPDVVVEIPEARQIVLGPEPLIGAQRLVLRLDQQQLILETDGLGPFVVRNLNDSDRNPAN